MLERKEKIMAKGGGGGKLKRRTFSAETFVFAVFFFFPLSVALFALTVSSRVLGKRSPV